MSELTLLALAVPVIGAIVLVTIAALSGRKIEISRSKITFWAKR